MKRVLLIVYFFVASVPIGYTQVLPQDSLALVALYNANGGTNWYYENTEMGPGNEYSHHDTWLIKKVSEWAGVTVVNNRVRALKLTNCGLTGTLSSGLCNLTALSYFDFSWNGLSASFPSCIDNMVMLDSFDISFNSFTGAFPATVTALPRLSSMLLTANNFSDFPNVSSMTQLRKVLMTENLFTFEDIIPNISVSGIVYNPQGLIVVPYPNLNINVNRTFTMSVTVGGQGNVYQWQHYFDDIQDNERFSGSRTNTLTNSRAKAIDDGFYSCTITNPAVPSLTIRATMGGRVNVSETRAPQTITILNSGTMFCGDTLQLSSTSSSGLPVSYKLADGTLLSNRFAPAQDLLYTIIAFNEYDDNYQEAYDTTEIQVLTHQPIPVFSIAHDLPIYEGEDLFLSVEDVPGLSYLWETPDGHAFSTSEIVLPALSRTQQGQYRVWITEGSCRYDSLTLDVMVSVDSNVVIYELITPNGDGNNETFFIKNIEHIPSVNVTVYNALSQVVFQENAYTNNWNGGELPVGTYYYLVKVEEWNKVYEGNIYIKR